MKLHKIIKPVAILLAALTLGASAAACGPVSIYED